MAKNEIIHQELITSADLLEHTINAEEFRLAVTASDPVLLAAYKKYLLSSLEVDQKASEYKLRDMELAEAERLRKMEEVSKNMNKYGASRTM